MVHGTCVISASLSKPELHCEFHLWSFAIGMSTLSANDFEEVVLTITTIVLNAAAFRVGKIFFNLGEPICSHLEGFLDTDYMQVNTVAWMFLFN